MILRVAMDYPWIVIIIHNSCSSYSRVQSASVVIMKLRKNHQSSIAAKQSSVNKRDNDNETQTIKSRRGLVKVSTLSKKCSMQSGRRLSWIMLQKVDEMYRDLKHQETLKTALAIQNLKYPRFDFLHHPSHINCHN